MNVLFFDNDNLQNQAQQPCRLETLETAVPVTGKDYKSVADHSESANLSQNVRKVRIQLIFMSCSSNSISDVFSVSSCRRLSVNYTRDSEIN